VPRRIDDFHALSVMGAILGGLFNSRLNMKLREEKGYTYGAGAGFDLRARRRALQRPGRGQHGGHGPGRRRLVAELDRIRDTEVTTAELDAARDFLVGVFPLRFETPGPIVGALPGCSSMTCRTTSSSATGRRSRRSTSAQSARPPSADQPGAMAIVLVGDADTFSKDLEAAGLGPVSVERDEGPVEEGRAQPAVAAVRPLDAGEEGPTEGAEEPAGDTTDEGAAGTTPGETADAP
jgi:hypothetical protein